MAIKGIITGYALLEDGTALLNIKAEVPDQLPLGAIEINPVKEVKK